MSLLNNSVDLSKNSVILCDNKGILNILSFLDMKNIMEVLQNVLSKCINGKNICVGLLMDHNIYIPSIILSLQKLKFTFVFLTLKNFNKTISHLKCSWILSFDDVKQLSSFQEVDKLTLNSTSLVLWNRIDPVLEELNFQNVFCVVQTSGTTGENKLIRVTNDCIEANVTSLRNIFHTSIGDLIFWGTKLTFDPSLIEMALALQSGACLLIVPHKVFINSKALYEALFNIAHVTFLQMVPSVFLRWNEHEIAQILLNPQLRVLAFGGENFPKSILPYEKGNHLRIFNLYGISEVSCWATIHELTDESINDEIPIGKCLEATIIQLQNEFGTVVNEGKGEIFIGSSSRICYINDELPTKITGTVFRGTGDIAEVIEKGIFLVGRKNKVIKRFGHRINLTRMENKILQETGLENRCIWSEQNHKLLTFILMPMRNLDMTVKSKTLDKLRIKLLNILPEESFPDFIEIVTHFPLTCHGKVNERALGKLYNKSEPPMSCVDTFQQLWCRYTGITEDDLNELKHRTFLEVGGNSISALQLLSEFKDIIELEYPEKLVTAIFENSYEDCLSCLEKFNSVLGKRNNDSTIRETATKRMKNEEDTLKILWFYDLKACVDSSPLVFEKGEATYLAIGSFSHKFVIFREDGKVIYEISLPDSIESTPSISPCKNFILVGCFNGTMYCLDFEKKRIVWEFLTGSKIKSSACFCRKQSAAVFGSYDNVLYCILMMDGSKIWSTFLDGSISSSPIYSENKKAIIAATTKGMCFCLNEEDGGVTWKNNCCSPIFGTPCMVDSNESVVFPTVLGVLHCLRIKNGEQLWKYEAGGHIFSSLTLQKNFILFGCHDKTINVLQISTTSCTLVTKIIVDSEVSTTPFVYDMNGNNVIVTACNSGTMSVVDFKTFEVLGGIRLPGEVFSSPVVYNDKIFVGCRDNNFYCIELNK